MATIKFFNGERYVEVEVTDEFAKQYKQMEREEALNERTETRRHQSLEQSMESGHDFVDESVDVEELIQKKCASALLFNAIYQLPLEQRNLIKAVFFDNISQSEIAASKGVVKAAISNKIIRILKKLKKFYEKA